MEFYDFVSTIVLESEKKKKIKNLEIVVKNKADQKSIFIF